MKAGHSAKAYNEEHEVTGKVSLNRPESSLTNPPGHLWRDKWTALSGPLSPSTSLRRAVFATLTSAAWLPGVAVYRGTSLIRKHPPPYDPHWALGIVLL